MGVSFKATRQKKSTILLVWSQTMDTIKAGRYDSHSQRRLC